MVAGRAACAAAAAALLLATAPQRAAAKLVGAAVLPHGDFAYDPSIVHFANGSKELHNASLRLGRLVAEDFAPDVIFLTTPHGLELSSDFMIYENSQEVGAAPLDDVPHAANYTVPLALRTDVALARSLRKRLRALGLPVSGIEGFSDSQPLPVSWGEILPLSYVNASVAAGKMPPVVIMSVPSRRFNHSTEMVPEMLHLGAALGEALEADGRRVAWVVSADLAHTHLASGPYGYCPCARVYDEAVGAWLRRLEPENLLVRATAEQRAGAMSCGYTGLVLLEGAVRATGRDSWRSELWAYAAPTYYGMAVAPLTRRPSAPAQSEQLLLV